MRRSGSIPPFTQYGDVFKYNAPYSRPTEGGSRWVSRNSDGMFIIPVNGLKPGGGPWGDSSDARIKNQHGSYDSGLEAIVALQPVRYSFKGNDGAPGEDSAHKQVAENAIEYIGLIAQDTETAMPEMVKQGPGHIDGQAVVQQI